MAGRQSLIAGMFQTAKKRNAKSTLTYPLSHKPPKAVSPWLARSDRPGTHSKGRVTRCCHAIGAGDWVYPIVNIIIFNKTGKFTCIVLLNDDVGGIFPPPAPIRA